MTTPTTGPIIDVDVPAGILTIDQRAFPSYGEFKLRLMLFLEQHRGRIVTYEQILRHLYDDHGKPRPASKTVKVFVCGLRDALEAAGYPRTIIANVHDEGYCFCE